MTAPGGTVVASGRVREPRSLRARLTLWYAVALAVPLALFAVLCYGIYARALQQRTDRFIGDALAVFAREAGVERRLHTSAVDALATTVREVKFRDVRIVVRNSAGTIVAMGPDADSASGRGDRVLAALAAQASDSGAVTVPGPRGGDRIIIRPLDLGGERFRIGGEYPMRDVVDLLAGIRSVFLVAIPLLVVVAAVGAYVLANRGLAPLATMAARAGTMTATDLHERLPVAGGAELAGVARAFNELLDRLEHALSQQRRFMADASHELRTPTAVLKAEAEVTLAREHRTEAEYRESVTVMLQASQRLSRIVDDLFLLGRADAGHLVVRDAPVYLEEIVHDATRAVVHVGERRGVRVELRQMVQAPFHGDPDLLGRLLLNLLDNAIKYSPAGGTVEVAMHSDGRGHEISVTDQGPGIAPEAVETIFGRFFRGDDARSRPADSVTDGAGLGLAIARRIAVAHGGTLVVAESRPGRTEFRLTLPAEAG